MSEEKYLWRYNFGFVKNKLEEYYGKKSISSAYDEVEKYLMEHGFDNKGPQHGSGYFTSEKYTAEQAQEIIKAMFTEMPWFPYCLDLDKEKLTVESEVKYSHTEMLNRLAQDEEQIKRLNEYYDSIGMPEKKMVLPSEM